MYFTILLWKTWSSLDDYASVDVTFKKTKPTSHDKSYIRCTTIDSDGI